MNISNATFVKSSSKYEECPESNIPEYAFIGRSNVGKSSLINKLTNKKKLAKTSQTPGKTQLINHFLINESWYLVDLPGYGWAKVPVAEKNKWETMIKDYLLNRPNLSTVLVLVDSRHKAQKIDLEFMQWLGENEVPFIIVFTKADKLKKEVELESNIKAYENTMLEIWEEMPEYFITSSVEGRGTEDVLSFIDNINKEILK